MNIYLATKYNLESTVDSDGDGFTDAVEIAAGSLATDATSSPFPDFSETVGAMINSDDADATGLAGVEGNLKLWLDASNINGQDNDNISNGDSISEWIDLSGNGLHLSQDTQANQPVYNDSDATFKTVGVKDEFSQSLSVSNVNSELLDLTSSNTELTVFMVRKDYNRSELSQNNPHVLSYSNNSKTSVLIYRAIYGGTNDNKFIVHDPGGWTNSYMYSQNSASDERSINIFRRELSSVEYYKNNPLTVNSSDTGASGIVSGALDGTNTLRLFAHPVELPLILPRCLFLIKH